MMTLAVLLLSVALSEFPQGQTPPASGNPSAVVNSVRLHLPAGATAVIKNIAGLLARRIEERSGARVLPEGPADLEIDLAIEPGIGAEGYAVSDSAGHGIRIAGNDERGLLYGVGKFLRIADFSEQGLIFGSWRGRWVPDGSVRGIYFRRPLPELL